MSNNASRYARAILVIYSSIPWAIERSAAEYESKRNWHRTRLVAFGHAVRVFPKWLRNRCVAWDPATMEFRSWKWDMTEAEAQADAAYWTRFWDAIHQSQGK